MTVTSHRSFAGIARAAALCLTALVFFIPLEARAAWGQKEIDFTTYDVPLYEQIVGRIQAKILSRLGEGPNLKDRYFIVPFAYENRGNDPEFSHSYISVIRVFADKKTHRQTDGLKLRTFRNRKFEAFTISWLPSDFLERPYLRVFEGFCPRLFAALNKCPVSHGKNFNLADTTKLAVKAKVAVAMWGPYEIAKEGFDLGVRRMRLLDTNVIKYRADDRELRKKHVAINCFHAMAGLDKLFPNGGLFGTGFKMWGINGTRRVLIEYTSVAKYKGLLLEPVDAKKDIYGFVYAPTPSPKGVYNPFKRASAYHR